MSVRGGYQQPGRGGGSDRGRGAGDRGGRGGGGEVVRGRGGAATPAPAAPPIRGGADVPRGGGRGGAPGAAAASATSATSLPTIAATELPALAVGSAMPILFGGKRDRIFEAEAATAAKGTAAQKSALHDRVTAAKLQARQSIASVQTIARPPATAGHQVINVTSNYFPVRIDEGNNLYQYSVVFEPDVRNPRARRMILSKLLEPVIQANGTAEPLLAKNIAFSAKPLHDARASTSVRVAHTAVAGAKGWRSKDIAVTLTFTNTITRSRGGLSTDEYTVLGNVLREGIERTGLVKIGGAYFDVDGSYSQPQTLRCQHDEYGSLQLMQGINVVLHPTSRGLMLNVDLTFRSTRAGTILDHIKAVREYSKGAKPEVVKSIVKQELEGSIAVTTYLHERRKQTFKVTEVRFDLTPLSPLPGDPKKTTFKAYMEEHHGLTCTDLTQPLILVRLEKELDRDGKPKELYYLPEFARLAGQSNKMRANSYLQQELKRVCIVGPEVRFPAIAGLVQKLAAADSPAAQFLRQWGVTIVPKMVNVPAHMAPIAPLVTGGGRPLRQNEAQRSWLLSKGVTVAAVGTVPSKWVVVHPLPPAQYDAFVRSIVDDTINTLGCAWPEPAQVGYRSARGARENRDAIGQAFQQLDEDVKFVVVVLPDNNEDIYREIKKTTLQEWKIPSQCVLFKNATKPDPRQLLNVTSRVAGQMLVKAGYALWLSAPTGFAHADTMVCGLSFSTGAGKRTAALVACNATNLSVVSCSSKEVGADLGATLEWLVSKAAAAFQEKTKRPVKHIVVYRPGMHEGAFEKVVVEEVTPVQALCGKRGVKLCFITSLKRCHARTMPAPPGMIIDDYILPPVGYSWLEVPQVVNMGTATAMKFSMLSNDIAFTDGGAIEKLTHALCHMFQGWWASTREPSVVMYATRLAELHSLMKPGEEIHWAGGAVPAL